MDLDRRRADLRHRLKRRERQKDRVRARWLKSRERRCILDWCDDDNDPLADLNDTVDNLDKADLNGTCVVANNGFLSWEAANIYWSVTYYMGVTGDKAIPDPTQFYNMYVSLKEMMLSL